MTEKVGRNDPCPCGSGKKYKNCCLLKKQQSASVRPLSGRKFTAKVLSSGATEKPKPTPEQKAINDYTTLMERSFGSAIYTDGDKPSLPENPFDYLQEESKENS